MRIAYGDLIGGLSGDMFVAALIDLGLSSSKLTSELKKIPTLRFQLRTAKKTVHGIRAATLRVICPAPEPPRSWKEIRGLIRRSKIVPAVKELGLEMFSRLAEVEGKIHGVSPERVHFHEVGATDSIVDIMAAAIGCRELGVDTFRFSPVPLGRGLTPSRHGTLPLPAPATLELLKGAPVEGVDIDGETVTPTGAVIVSVLAGGYGAPPPMKIEKIGYATGHKAWRQRPNLFRLVLGADSAPWAEEAMLVIETNIDDMNPEYYDYVLDRLFAAGARDVFMTPVQMKKNRPGTLLHVIAKPEDREKLARIVLSETSTIGLRYYPVGRLTLARSSAVVKTRYGNIRMKIVEQPDGRSRAAPEYDDLKRVAETRKIPLKRVHDEILKSFRR